MKITPHQHAVLAVVQTGGPVGARQLAEGDAFVTREIVSYQHSRDGDAIVAHRTVLSPDVSARTGNPRLDYRVEMFRIQRDGAVTRL